MLKFFLDINISPQVKEFLINLGYEAFHAADFDLFKAKDREILEKAVELDSILLTIDLDFGALLAVEGIVVPGVIIFRLENPSREQMQQRLFQLLKRYSEKELKETLIIIEPTRIRRRELPILKNVRYKREK